jgi:hypothetical protein
MRIKTLRCLQPIDQQADCVVIQDDFGNPLFAAAHVGETIICAGVGDKDFKSVLEMIGLPVPEIVELKLPT